VICMGRSKKYRRMKRELERLRRKIRERELEDLQDEVLALRYERERKVIGVV